MDTLSPLFHIGLFVCLGLCVTNKSEYYARYKEKKQAQAAAPAAAAAGLCAPLLPQHPFIAACSAPIGGDALF